MKHARSTTAPENIQEVIDAESSAAYATLGGQQQYCTPDWLADQCSARLPGSPTTILDPQCGSGAMLNVGSWGVNKFGIDIDNRIDGTACNLVTGNCIKVFEAIDDLYPHLLFDCINANPPFSKKWKLANGDVVDSTEWTWKQVTKRGSYGYFIANHSTLEKLGIDKHPWVYHYEQHDGTKLWKGMRDTLKIGIAFWKNPAAVARTTDPVEIKAAWQRIQKVVDEEKVSRPDFNIYLNKAGYLRTYLSTRASIKRKINRDQILRLATIDECHPLTLTTEKETRDLLSELVTCGLYTIQPEAKRAIVTALAEVKSLSCPLMPVTDFETVGYCDEEDALTCVHTTATPQMQFTAGKVYKLTTGTYKFTQKFTRKKAHFDEHSRTMYTAMHDCQLSGQDRYIQFTDDRGQPIRFMEKPLHPEWNFPESYLWKIFDRPKVKTIAETNPEAVDLAKAVMRSCEMLAGYEYYPGQLSYLSRVASKPCAIVAADTGTGKTLMAISLLAMKGPERALIVAPQGTMRSSSEEDGEETTSEDYNASQWVQEISRFAPHLQIWEIFSYEDYERICSLNGGELPPGVYVTYYEAMFLNGARETAPESWDDTKLNKWCVSHGYAPFPDPTKEEKDAGVSARRWCDTIGNEVNGIRSIIAPCLSTRIGHMFDMVLLDEAHRVANLSANITQMLIRLQPKHRYALTATPIPNDVSNLFSVLGWIAVPDWYKGGRRNAGWPYAREELGRFEATFKSVERDFTEEDFRAKADPKYRGKCEKPSPVISSPARLLKLLKPWMAYLSKPDCNPAYIPPKVVDVRVPMGKEQAELYGYYLDRGHIPGGHPLIRARKQSAWLRGICADPAGFRHGGPGTPKVRSNMNPKVIALLELTRDVLAKGKQFLIINSRVGLSNTIQHKLAEAGVRIARIDSTVPADQHAYQANLFKSGKADVLLLGLKCAAAYSFDECEYEAIGSIEWSPGPKKQAEGRIDRVTNKVEKTIYCILFENTIEEVMFDTVATKDDAATICLKGMRIPRDFVPVDGSSILAEAIERFDIRTAVQESECDKQWPKLCAAIKSALLQTRLY